MPDSCVLSNLLKKLSYGHSEVLLTSLLDEIEHFHVLCYLDALIDGVIILGVVIYQRLTQSIDAYSHLCFDKCL